jgi:hypothetical protein
MAFSSPDSLFSVMGGSGTKRRTDFHAPGLPESDTVRQRFEDAPAGDRSNVDSPQVVVSVTCMFQPPPIHPDGLCAVEDLYAPRSVHPLANIARSGEIAFMAPEDANWMSSVTSSSLNPYSNATAGFTNFGGVHKNTKVRVVGQVGNASMQKEGDTTVDFYGQVFSAGALTTMNSGPKKIQPARVIYASPHPYTLTDAEGNKRPGYINPGWPDGCDKWLCSIHALEETDSAAAFLSLEMDIYDAACASSSSGAFIDEQRTLLSKLVSDEHLPLYSYAAVYSPMARCKFLVTLIRKKMKATTAEDDTVPALKEDLIVAMDECKHQNAKYWQDSDDLLNSVNLASGSTDDMHNIQKSQTPEPLTSQSSWLHMIDAYCILQEACFQIFKVAIGAQNAFIRSFVIGKSRYESNVGQMLDYSAGFGYA